MKKSDQKFKKSPEQHVPGSFLWEDLRDAQRKKSNSKGELNEPEFPEQKLIYIGYHHKLNL